jgi:lysophospholipase L1-like esterase
MKGITLASLLLAVHGGAVAQTRTIAVIGASTAAGVGATVYDSAFAGRYARYLQGLSPAWTLANLGVSGYTTFQEMPDGYVPPAGRPKPDTAHNLSKALALHPRALLICMGSNDIANGYPASEYESNYDSLRAWAERAGVPVWVATPLPRSAVDAGKRQMILALRDRILARYAPRAIDFYDSLGDAQGNYYPAFNSGDGVHTNNHGHRLLYERVVAAGLTDPAAVSLGDPEGRDGARSAIKAVLPLIPALDGRGRMLLPDPETWRLRDIRGRAALP